MKLLTDPITRRAFLKRIALIGGGMAAASVAGGVGWRFLQKPPQDLTEQIARREKERRHDGRGWLTIDEYATVAALGAVLIPSDGGDPGANEAGVTAQIDRMLARTPRFQTTYAEGLLALDSLSQSLHNAPFSGLNYDHQLHLVEIVDRAKQILETEPVSFPAMVERKLRFLYYSWMGVSKPAIYFLDRVAEDVTGAFYSSKVAWDWLGYDGPPFPNGYAGRMNHRCQS